MHLVRACNYSIQGGSMRIAGSRIAFQATHQEVQRHEEKLSVRFWTDGENSTARKEPLDRVELSRQGKKKCSCAEQQRIDEANSETYHESEETTFASQGRITTADGHQIDFTIKLEMSRSFTEHRTFNLSIGDARLIDPLVLNFEGTRTQLSDRVFTFDLNNDGTLENLNFVDKGSGYLVYDKNGDGTINNGTEMFGAVTGDGFGELAQYDHDGNGWIDEGDDIFEKLKVWKQDGLHSLSSKNIGAIYLKAVDTPFALTKGRQQQGQIQQTGLVVNEDYSIGTIQKVDYVV